MAEKRPGNSQGLSPTALRAKRARDKAMAMTTDRKKKKAENRRTSIAYNRATHDRNEIKT